MSTLDDQYLELQHAKHEVIDDIKSGDNHISQSLTKLEEACEKICFDYEGELQHCKDIAYEDRI